MRKHLITVSCVSVLFLWGVSNAADPNAQQDIVTKSKSGDLLTSPQKKKSGSSDAVTTKAKDSSNKSGASQPSSAQTQPFSKAEAAKPIKDYLDVYIGKCQFTTEAVASVRRFAAEHPTLFVRFYAMKTESEAMPDADTLKGLEIYLPIEAGRFAIATVPTFIINTRGTTYKISGATEIADFYEKISKNTIKGENKKGYIDLGDQGRGCPAIMPDLRPAALSPAQRQQIMAEGRAPDMRGILLANRVSVPQSSQPVYLERQVARLPLSTRFIVFSQGQTDWAIKELKRGSSTGCCTDCLELAKLWPYAQYCSKDLLTKLGISSVPTIVTFHAAAQR